MAGDDGSRRPPQAYATVSPAGVGPTTTNDQSLIDHALDQLTADDLTAYLQSPPSRRWRTRPASTLSKRTPTPSPSPRSRRTQLRQRILAAAGAGGGGSDGSFVRSTPRGRPGHGRGRGRRPRRPQPSPSLPWSPPRPSQQATSRGSPRTLDQADLQRRLRMLLQDQGQFSQGRKIANITTTNSM